MTIGWDYQKEDLGLGFIYSLFFLINDSLELNFAIFVGLVYLATFIIYRDYRRIIFFNITIVLCCLYFYLSSADAGGSILDRRILDLLLFPVLYLLCIEKSVRGNIILGVVFGFFIFCRSSLLVFSLTPILLLLLNAHRYRSCEFRSRVRTTVVLLGSVVISVYLFRLLLLDPVYGAAVQGHQIWHALVAGISTLSEFRTMYSLDIGDLAGPIVFHQHCASYVVSTCVQHDTVLYESVLRDWLLKEFLTVENLWILVTGKLGQAFDLFSDSGFLMVWVVVICVSQMKWLSDQIVNYGIFTSISAIPGLLVAFTEAYASLFEGLVVVFLVSIVGFICSYLQKRRA